MGKINSIQLNKRGSEPIDIVFQNEITIEIKECVIPKWARIDESTLIITELFLGSKQEVQDVYRYDLNIIGGEWELSSIKGGGERVDSSEKEAIGHNDVKLDDPNNKLPGKPEHRIALILESPHTSEYNENHEPIGPAIGQTGGNISEYLPAHVIPFLQAMGLELDSGATYHLLLVNPVPVQTSLGSIIKSSSNNKKIRDMVWERLYTQRYKDTFASRLELYEPGIIINACTAEIKKKLKFSRSFPAQLFATPHPSSWHYLKSFQPIA